MADRTITQKYLLFTHGDGKDILNNLKHKYRRTTKETPMETHICNAQADVIDFIERNMNSALQQQEKK